MPDRKLRADWIPVKRLWEASGQRELPDVGLVPPEDQEKAALVARERVGVDRAGIGALAEVVRFQHDVFRAAREVYGVEAVRPQEQQRLVPDPGGRIVGVPIDLAVGLRLEGVDSERSPARRMEQDAGEPGSVVRPDGVGEGA